MMPDALCAVAEYVQVLTPAEFKLFSVIASTAWSLKSDETRASWDALQAVTGLGRTTVYEALKGIEEKGAVIPLGRPHGVRATIYRIPCLSGLLQMPEQSLRGDPVLLDRGSESEPLAARLVPLGRGSDSEPVLVGRGSESERVSGQNPLRGSESEPLAARAYKESLTHSPTVEKFRNEKVSECSSTCLRIAEIVKQVFGFEPSPRDPKIVELTKRIEQLALPVASLARYLRHVQQKKRRARYTVESFGAVFGWAITQGDLFAWIQQQEHRMFELDREIENAPSGEIRNAPVEASAPPSALQTHMSLEEKIATVERLLEVFPNHFQTAAWRAELAALQDQPKRAHASAAGGMR